MYFQYALLEYDDIGLIVEWLELWLSMSLVRTPNQDWISVVTTILL